MSRTKPAQPIRVYGAKLSGHTHRVLLFLSLLELPFELVEVDMKAGEHKGARFLAKNPLGQVPVIEDGATVLCDSNAILVYLASEYDNGKWLPRDPLGAAGVQRWFSLATGEILRGPGFARLVNLFGAPHNHDQAKATAVALFKTLDGNCAASALHWARRRLWPTSRHTPISPAHRKAAFRSNLTQA